MTAELGILAFGSLIDRPGWEIEQAIVTRKSGIRTPFSVEFARSSRTRAGAPTLVPVEAGGLITRQKTQDGAKRLLPQGPAHRIALASDNKPIAVKHIVKESVNG